MDIEKSATSYQTKLSGSVFGNFLCYGYNWQPYKLLLLLLSGFMLSSCVGRRLPVLSTQINLFIPPAERSIYVNECVNLTSDFKLGREVTSVLRKYYNQHASIKNVPYKKAQLLLTLYLHSYKVTELARVDYTGAKARRVDLTVEVNLLRKKAQPTAGAYQYGYLRRHSLSFRATSDEIRAVPVTPYLLHVRLYSKLLKSLDYYFTHGRFPAGIS